MNAPALAWLNGSFQPLSDTHIPVTDRGFLLADGIFDTMAAAGGHLIHPQEHLKRLYENASVMALEIPYAPEILLQAAVRLVDENGLQSGHVSIRTTVTRGTAPRGLKPPAPSGTIPTVLMTATAFDPGHFEKPARLILSRDVRRNEGSKLSRIKSLNYGDNILAVMEAQRAGVDDALMMNNKGHIACGTNCNVFIVKDGKWITPPLSDGVLSGITRSKILQEKEALEASFDEKALKSADQVFITNSIIGLRPVVQIDKTRYSL